MADPNEEELKKLEESYRLAADDDDFIFAKSDIEYAWQHGYQTAWARLSIFLIVLGCFNLVSLILIFIALLLK